MFKSILKRKFSAHSVLKSELLSNPNFDQAFPHLKKYKPNTKLPKDKKELGFIRSLLYHINLFDYL